MKLADRRVAAFCALLALSLPAPAAVADFGFRILRAELKLDESGKEYALDADIDYRFSEPAIDALRNGVPLTLVLRITVRQDQQGWWWDKTLADEKRFFHVRYHALSKLFQMVDEHRELPRNFVSINALLEAMGSIRGLPVVPAKRLVTGQRFRASLEVSMDIESLPLPLRPVAYISPSWHLNSPPYKWTFED